MNETTLFRPILIFLLMSFCGNSYSLDCPPPPQQFEKDIGVKARGELKGALSKLVSGELSGDMSTSVTNLMKEYPNADRLFVVQGIMSMYCQIINESTTWSDDKKLEAIEKMNAQLLLFIYQRDDKGSKTDVPEFEYRIDQNENSISMLSIGGQYFNLNVEQYPLMVCFGIQCKKPGAGGGLTLGEPVCLDWKHASVANVDQIPRSGHAESFQAPSAETKKEMNSDYLAIVTRFEKIEPSWKNWFVLLDRELRRSNNCFTNARYEVAVKFSYQDALGATHYRRFLAHKTYYPETHYPGENDERDIVLHTINETRFDQFKQQHVRCHHVEMLPFIYRLGDTERDDWMMDEVKKDVKIVSDRINSLLKQYGTADD